MSNATLAIADLATKLAAVAPVRTGRAALETTSAALPVITIWSTSDRPADEQGYGYALQYTRSVIIECQIAASAAYHDALDTVLTGIRRALQQDWRNVSPLSGHATSLRQNTASFYIPADNSTVAVVQVALEFDYLERFT